MTKTLKSRPFIGPAFSIVWRVFDEKNSFSACNPWTYNGIDGLLGSLLGTDLLVPFMISFAVLLVGLFLAWREAYGGKR